MWKAVHTFGYRQSLPPEDRNTLALSIEAK
jgi:hypothetical protein